MPAQMPGRWCKVYVLGAAALLINPLGRCLPRQQQQQQKQEQEQEQETETGEEPIAQPPPKYIS